VARVAHQEENGVRGRVQAVDKASAELVAATEFQLNDHQRTRLFIEEGS
jgi:hypothetical protein